MHFEDWRPGDQRYYVSDTRKFQAATGWRPRVDVEEGVLRLREWLLELTAGRAEQLATAG
jgi:CDP-paratose 2-epimerase